MVTLAYLPGVAEGAGLPDQQQCRMLWQQKHSIKPVIEGWCLLIDRNRGNCLACHNVVVDAWPEFLPVAGNAGPVLENLSDKYASRVEVRNLVYDASKNFPDTVMPQYGGHGILSDLEIDLIVEFLMGI